VVLSSEKRRLQCDLPKRGVNGRSGSAGTPAPGLAPIDPGTTSSEFVFEGLACDGGLIFESYCVAGTFDWRLNGAFGAAVVDDQHVVARGVLCASEPRGSCPTL